MPVFLYPFINRPSLHFLGTNCLRDYINAPGQTVSSDLMEPSAGSGVTTNAVVNSFYNDYQTFEVDPRISYPSYVSLDEFLDIDLLRALDHPMVAKINQHIAAEKGDYFRNLYRLDSETPYAPGVREVWLTRIDREAPPEYLDLMSI